MKPLHWGLIAVGAGVAAYLWGRSVANRQHALAVKMATDPVWVAANPAPALVPVAAPPKLPSSVVSKVGPAFNPQALQQPQPSQDYILSGGQQILGGMQ